MKIPYNFLNLQKFKKVLKLCFLKLKKNGIYFYFKIGRISN